MSLKDEYTFCFSNFLVTVLFKFSANLWLSKISFLTVDLSTCLTGPFEDFLSLDIHHILDDIVFLGKSVKSP